MKKKIWIVFGIAILVVVNVLVIMWIAGRSETSLLKVNDESIGIAFAITKEFKRINQSELIKLNPAFVFGYQHQSDSGVSCYISQTQLLKPGTITPEYLREGTLGELRKSLPDVQLADSKPIQLGKGVSGVLMQLTYTDNSVAYRRVEAVGTTPSFATFAYCDAPESSYSNYASEFEDFIGSLRLS